jgi:hypothetical protein
VQQATPSGGPCPWAGFGPVAGKSFSNSDFF